MEHAATAPAQEKKNGFLNRLRAITPDIIKNNAPRIVAGMKICSSLVAFSSKNRMFSTAGAGFIGAFSIITLFGKKKTEEEKAKLRQETGAKSKDKPRGRISEYFYKLFHPKQYPIESGTGLAMLSSVCWMIAGLTDKDGFSPDLFVGGALSLASDANVVFTKERIGEEKANPHPKRTPKYYITELKNRPVLVSSLCNIGSDIASIAFGGMKYFKQGGEPNRFIVGLILLTANAFQAIFVNKNDYNVENKPPTESGTKATKSIAPIGDPEKADAATTLSTFQTPATLKAAWSQRAPVSGITATRYAPAL